MAKKYGGATLSKQQLNEIRKISKLCCDNENVVAYVKNICDLVVQLVKEYAIYYKKNVDNELFIRLHQNNKTSPGQIENLQDLKEVIQYGNLRERMALIMNFGLFGCDIVIWAMATKNHLISSSFIKEQSKRLKLLTGLDILDIYHMLKCKKTSNCTTLEEIPCKFSLFTQDGSVLLSRYSEFPMITSSRFKRPEQVEIEELKKNLQNSSENKLQIQTQIDTLMEKNKKQYSMNVNEIYPPLSDREKQFIQIDKNTIYPPYISGYMLFDTNEKNYYNILAQHYNQIVAAGPSGSTDLFLITSKMFKDFNLNLGILACVGWMCNIPQHSVFEILMGSLPFGLNNWSPKINSHEYIKNLNETVKKYPISQKYLSKSKTTTSLYS